MEEKKFKIVQTLPALAWGGAQVLCIQLCNELAKYPNYEITLVSMYDYDALKYMPSGILDKKVKFITLGKHRGPDPRMFFRIYKLLNRIRPNVVHSHLHSGYYCLLAYLRIKDYSYKKVHTFHNIVTKDAPWYGRQAYKYFFRKGIVQPVSISDEVNKSAIREYAGCHTIQINNGSLPVQKTEEFNKTSLDIQKLKKNSSTKVLINIARISKQKNQQLLLKCMRTLEEEGENLIALILGDYVPGDEKIYKELISKKPKNVFFMGNVNNVGDYLLNADAFVLSSIFEGMPISLLEALSVGVVPICTPVGGLINIVTKSIGFLSKAVNYESYLAAIKAWLNTPVDEIERLKKNGKELYQKEFSMESCAAKYNRLYTL